MAFTRPAKHSRRSSSEECSKFFVDRPNAAITTAALLCAYSSPSRPESLLACWTAHRLPVVAHRSICWGVQYRSLNPSRSFGFNTSLSMAAIRGSCECTPPWRRCHAERSAIPTDSAEPAPVAISMIAAFCSGATEKQAAEYFVCRGVKIFGSRVSLRNPLYFGP
jgi:hypothetical protein